MSKLRTHYDNLKVARDAPDFVIRAAYRTLSQRYHPDKHPGDERAVRVMAIINQSYEVLSDPVRRRDHDAWIASEERKLKQHERPQAPPIPPEWQKQQEPEQPQEPRKSRLASVLLWPLKALITVIAVAPRVVLPLLLLGGFLLWDAVTPDRPRRPPPAGPKPYQATAPVRPALASTPPVPEKPPYIRPEAAPNGSPWPVRSAYVKGYPIDHDRGHSEITVDNTRNDADVFVKLVSLDGDAAYPVRQFYIPKGGKFTMNKVDPGSYDLRYMDLGNGGLSRSEAFDVEERHTYDGIEYSSMTMTLYKVRDGNFQTYDLAESEF